MFDWRQGACGELSGGVGCGYMGRMLTTDKINNVSFLTQFKILVHVESM